MSRVEERLTELLHAAAPPSRGVSFHAVEREVHHRRTVRRSFAASAAALAVVAVGLSVTATSGNRGSSKLPTASAVNLAGAVPWTAAPPPHEEGTSSPPTAGPR